MSKFKKALLCSIAPMLVAGMLGVTTQAVASGERLYGRFTNDNELYAPRDYREWVFIGSNVNAPIQQKKNQTPSNISSNII